MKGKNMDTNKWTSVAIKKQKHTVLKAICEGKYRAPGAMVEKLIDDYCDYQAKKNKVTTEQFVKELINGKHRD
jgi:hypothetical protein